MNDPTKHHARIVLGVSKSSVIIDGLDLAPVVQGLTLNAGYGLLSELTLDLAPGVVQIDGDVEVSLTMADEVREALIQLGWTPPDVQSTSSGETTS